MLSHVSPINWWNITVRCGQPVADLIFINALWMTYRLLWANLQTTDQSSCVANRDIKWKSQCCTTTDINKCLHLLLLRHTILMSFMASKYLQHKQLCHSVWPICRNCWLMHIANASIKRLPWWNVYIYKAKWHHFKGDGLATNHFHKR